MPILSMAEVIPASSPQYMGLLFPGLAPNLVSPNLTLYEVNPFEFGSWKGGRVQAFMPTREWLISV